MARQIFINLPVKDLPASIGFYETLGFTVNPEFSDATGACMVVSDQIFIMLLTHDKFQKFTSKEIADATKVAEAINTFSVENKTEVDELADKAVKAGGKIHHAPEDYGWMYGQSIEDLDGHIWEVFWMDAAKKQQ
jgi:predicted lactoylglutathione lyase